MLTRHTEGQGLGPGLFPVELPGIEPALKNVLNWETLVVTTWE